LPIHLQSPTIINAALSWQSSRAHFRPARVAARAAPHSPTQRGGTAGGQGLAALPHGWQRGRQPLPLVRGNRGTGGSLATAGALSSGGSATGGGARSVVGDGSRVFGRRNCNRRREPTGGSSTGGVLSSGGRATGGVNATVVGNRGSARGGSVSSTGGSGDGGNQRDWWFGDGRHRRGKPDCGRFGIRMLYPTLASGKEWYASGTTPARTFTAKIRTTPGSTPITAMPATRWRGTGILKITGGGAAHVCPRSALLGPVAGRGDHMYFQPRG